MAASSNMAASSDVATGLLDTEMVLRGGGLSEPVVLGGLKEVDGAYFVTIRKHDTTMHRFLTGKACHASLLTVSPVLDGLASLRASARAREAKGVKEEAPATDEPDPTELLGLDAGTRTPKLVRLRRSDLLKFSNIVPVEFKRDGFPTWEVRLLMAAGREAIAMEASAANFSALYAFVQDDLGARVAKASMGRGTTAERAPRGSQGSREYWRKDRKAWVTRQKVAGDSPQGTPTKKSSTPPKVRTITRRRSDGPDPKKRRVSARVASTSGTAGQQEDTDHALDALDTL